MAELPPMNLNALKSEIRQALINQKANSCPMAVRLAWHASGTYDKNDGSGGSNGATMRFAPESTDPANAGLSIERDILLPIKHNHPEISYADLWTLAGSLAVEFLGGPVVPHSFGRSDQSSGTKCPPNGRLPDAAQGADHVRAVFSRMGFNDQETVALCGAHTLGRCHKVRSGFDGPWTRNPLKFDNTFFKNLVHLQWKPRSWDGNFQYEDTQTGELMMLPTDIALIQDDSFRKYVEMYAADEQLFFKDFAAAFSKLLALGTDCDPNRIHFKRLSDKERAGLEFREAAMHGSLETVQKWSTHADVHELEATSGRSALHKAAFWGHIDTVKYLVNTCKIDVNGQDFNGDTPLHDACRFAHIEVVEVLVKAGTDLKLKNKAGQTPLDLAIIFGKDNVASCLRAAAKL